MSRDGLVVSLKSVSLKYLAFRLRWRWCDFQGKNVPSFASVLVSDRKCGLILLQKMRSLVVAGVCGCVLGRERRCGTRGQGAVPLITG